MRNPKDHNDDEDNLDPDDLNDNDPSLEEEYEPEIDEEEDDESADEEEELHGESEHYNSKAKIHSCIKNNYCSKCDGTPHEPEGLCRCTCHDIA